MSITAQILSQRTHRIPGKLQVTEYFFRVPLDHAHPGGPSLRLFARGVTKTEPGVCKEHLDTATAKSPARSKLPAASSSNPDSSSPRPWLAFFQGGPGFGCRPPSAGGWLGAAIDAGYRVLLLDHRGTGMSGAITPATLLEIGHQAQQQKREHSSISKEDSDNEPAIAAQAAYLRHFRAPAIVADAEAVRRALAISEGAELNRKWSVMGQSFGGFCVVYYLSNFPEGLTEAFTTGGLPPLAGHPDQIYNRLVQRWVSRGQEYYAKFPEDVQRVSDIAHYLKANNVCTRSGGRLSVNRLRGIGMDLGSQGGFERMHTLILRIAADLEWDGELSDVAIDDFERTGGVFDQAILYALLHEPCYMQGEAANWAAERAIAASPAFQLSSALASSDSSVTNSSPPCPFYFTAEAVTSSLFTDYPALQPFKGLAEHLAQCNDWAPLYDAAKLAQNSVPVYAASYFDDQYVDFELAQQTARAIKNCKVWVTNTAYHDAIRAKGEEVIKHLIDMRDDVVD